MTRHSSPCLLLLLNGPSSGGVTGRQSVGRNHSLSLLALKRARGNGQLIGEYKTYNIDYAVHWANRKLFH